MSDNNNIVPIGSKTDNVTPEQVLFDTLEIAEKRLVVVLTLFKEKDSDTILAKVNWSDLNSLSELTFLAASLNAQIARLIDGRTR